MLHHEDLLAVSLDQRQRFGNARSAGGTKRPQSARFFGEQSGVAATVALHEERPPVGEAHNRGVVYATAADAALSINDGIGAEAFADTLGEVLRVQPQVVDRKSLAQRNRPSSIISRITWHVRSTIS